MKPSKEQIEVLLQIQHRYNTDHWKGNKTFFEYVDMWWDYFWSRHVVNTK